MKRESHIWGKDGHRAWSTEGQENQTTRKEQHRPDRQGDVEKEGLMDGEWALSYKNHIEISVEERYFKEGGEKLKNCM